MRWFGWFRNPISEDRLAPGMCECDHGRCFHVRGRGACTVDYPADNEWPTGARCACEIFILDKDNGGDDTPEPPTDPAIKELEKIYKSPCS